MMSSARTENAFAGNAAREERDVARQSAERITVALIPKAAEELQQLHDRSGLSKTDIVNRAISLYEFFDSEFKAGNELLIRDSATGATHRVILL